MNKKEEMELRVDELADDMEKNITHLDDGMIKLQLVETLRFGKTELNHLVFRKARAKDMKGVPSFDKIECPDTAILLATRLCDLIESTDMAGELSWADTMAVMGVLTDFLVPSQATGKTA